MSSALSIDPDAPIRRYLRLFAEGEESSVTHERIELSLGTKSASSSGRLNYEEGASVPRLPFRAPTAAELSCMLFESRPFSTSGAIGICRPPVETFEKLAAIGRSIRDRQCKLETEAYKVGIRDLVGWLSKRYVFEDKYIVHGFSVDEPAALTTTIGRTGRLVGLHLDTWEYHRLDERASALNRFCLNAGEQARYLLAFNLDLVEMHGLLRDLCRVCVSNVHDIGPEFMRRFPDYPVVKVKINPGEAYIAPTDFVIHDATSLGLESSGCSFTIRGRFLV